ncbi:MAG: BatD family protein [Myxococcaceae bacterium]
MTVLLLSMMLLATDAGIDAPSQVLTRANPDKARIGDPFEVEVTITHPSDQRIDLHALADTGDFDVAEAKRTRIDGKDSSTTTFTLPMSAFQLGKQKTPELTFDVVQGTLTGSFSVPGPEVEIVSSLPKDVDEKGAGLFDVRPPGEVPIRTWRLLYALAAVAALALGAYAVRRWMKRPKPVLAGPPKPTLPLPQRTLAALDALRAEELPTKGRAQEFYFRLSEILRGYLGERYSFEAMECTSNELIDAIRRLHTPGLSMKELTEFALMSDLAKFAKILPSPDECKGSLEFGYRLVHTTTAAQAPAPTTAPQPPKPPDATRPRVP